MLISVTYTKKDAKMGSFKVNAPITALRLNFKFYFLRGFMGLVFSIFPIQARRRHFKD